MSDIGGAIGGFVGGPIGGAIGSKVGGMFGGKKKKPTTSRQANSEQSGNQLRYENEAMDYMDPTQVDPQTNQMTQDAIDRATSKAGAQLGVSQAQGGVTGGQAQAQQARQAGDIQGDLQYQDALQRRSELLGSRKDKANLKSDVLMRSMGG